MAPHFLWDTANVLSAHEAPYAQIQQALELDTYGLKSGLCYSLGMQPLAPLNLTDLTWKIRKQLLFHI